MSEARSSLKITFRVLWRTSGFLQGLALDLKTLAPDRAKTCLEFVNGLEEEARRLQAEQTVDGPTAMEADEILGRKHYSEH